MAIMVCNAGQRTVDSIVDRNALQKRFDGMRVTVLDATGDPQVGSGSAGYVWVEVGSRWALEWADVYPTMSFANESVLIDGDTVELSNVPSDGALFSAIIINPQGLILGDANITSIDLSTVTLATTEYSGNLLKVSYAYGSMASQIQVVMDQMNQRITEVVGPAPEELNTLKETADAIIATQANVTANAQAIDSLSLSTNESITTLSTLITNSITSLQSVIDSSLTQVNTSINLLQSSFDSLQSSLSSVSTSSTNTSNYVNTVLP